MTSNHCRAKNPATCWKHGQAYVVTNSMSTGDKNPPALHREVHPISLSVNQHEILDYWKVKPATSNQIQLNEQYFLERLKRVEQAFHEGTSTSNDARYVHTNGDWRKERVKAHNELIEETLYNARNTPCEHEIILMGGVSGAGKTNIRSNIENRENYFTIDPDDVRQALVEKGLAPHINGYEYLSPAERGSLLYYEASQVTARISQALRKQGTNLIVDQTMTNFEDTKKRLDYIRTSGYKSIKAIFVDIDVETSKMRAIARWRAGEEARLRKENIWGGRYMSPAVIALSAHPTSRSKNLENFKTLVQEQSFHSWQLWDNNTTGVKPKHIQQHNW